MCISCKLVCAIQSNYRLLSLSAIFYGYMFMRARLVKVPTLYFLYRKVLTVYD